MVGVCLNELRDGMKEEECLKERMSKQGVNFVKRNIKDKNR